MKLTIDNPILYHILKILANSNMPLGAKSISEKLEERGFHVKKETVQYYLKLLDELGLTKKVGLAGRIISKKGLEEVKKGMVRERIGSFIELREEYAYNANFDPFKRKGLVSLNIGIIRKRDLEKSLELIKACMDAKLAVSRFVKIYEREAGNTKIPKGKVGIGLVSTSVVDAALIGSRISSFPTFAGILQYSDWKPLRFVHAISYYGSTLDPIDLFIRSGFCSVKDAVERGNGNVPADVREIPLVLRKRAVEIIEQLEKIGINGAVYVSGAENDALGIPVNNYKAGVVVIAGSTPLVYLKEKGIDVEIKILAAFERIENLEEIDSLM
ncbi:Protein of unknown function DUF128 [Ferroglobus placidus DSM 10642]|uniref:DUF128 domain-containing protein n=1 Tax=Ferroglobus placidus (strain DSM 10642 / AEDII12DO) TaxID=589924 RepID=D3RXS6_FERPA|nr:NrpR regulatory domain-containing protein [Ferroglobus placidus]ADC65289.1 Protein of unknown function DUF128 [Ferroglobus placidus DSM 10642]